MDPTAIIAKYYRSSPRARRLLVDHSEAVAAKALAVARHVAHLGPDLDFLREAALLHDVGILWTRAPLLGCRGERPYVVHGVLGRELLEREGLPRHALVAERHVGVGLSAEDVRRSGLPLPERDMLPVSLEEKIVCFADKFFSKDGGSAREKPLEVVRASIARYGGEKLAVFDRWLCFFGYGEGECAADC
ncbi:MAG: HDIG domain-containing protein [Nitrospirota bacterium]|jgi:uncharacterized protein